MKIDANWRLVMQKDRELAIFKLTGSQGTSLEATLERTINLSSEHEQIISVSNGLAFV